MKIKYSADDLQRSVSGFADKPRMILVLLRHTLPNLSSKFIDLDVEIPFAGGTLAKFKSSLYEQTGSLLRGTWTCGRGPAARRSKIMGLRSKLG